MTEVVLGSETWGQWVSIGSSLEARTEAGDAPDVIWVRECGVMRRGTFDREWLRAHLGEWVPVETNKWGPHDVEVTAHPSDRIDSIRVRRA